MDSEFVFEEAEEKGLVGHSVFESATMSVASGLDTFM